MSYSIEQEPNQVTGVNNPMMYVVKESDGAITGANKFRYIIQVQTSTTNNSGFSTIAKIKIHKNQAGVGIIDVSRIIKTYLETQQINVGNQETIDGTIHSIGISDIGNTYSQNTSQLIGVRILGGYEKSSGPTTAPVEELAPSGTYTSSITYTIPATTPFTQLTLSGGLSVLSGNNPMKFFIPSASTKKFLTNSPRIQFVRGSSTSADNLDELTVGFLNKGLITTDIDAIVRIYIEYYNSSGVVIAGTTGGATQHYFDNDTSAGGKAIADAMKNSLIYFGCGTNNLQTQGDLPNARPSNFANWAYYRIWGADGSATQETDHYYFYRYGSGATVDDRHQSCTKYDNIRLAWRNRLGCWDYMNFRAKSVEDTSITKEEMASVPGNWDGSLFSYENSDSGRKVLYTEANKKLTINSDLLNEDEAVWLEELFTSTDVQILENDIRGSGYGSFVYPVIVTDKQYTKKTSVNNKAKIQYTIKLEYANKERTNS